MVPSSEPQNAGLRPCTPARERPLRRRGLSLALPRPGLTPGQGGRSRLPYRGEPASGCSAVARRCSGRVAGSVWCGRWRNAAVPRAAAATRARRSVEANLVSKQPRERARRRWVRMPCRWAARTRRSRSVPLPSVASSERRTGQAALARRPVAREGGARGGNHRVVPSSELRRCATVTFHTDARGPRRRAEIGGNSETSSAGNAPGTRSLVTPWICRYLASVVEKPSGPWLPRPRDSISR